MYYNGPIVSYLRRHHAGSKTIVIPSTDYDPFYAKPYEMFQCSSPAVLDQIKLDAYRKLLGHSFRMVVPCLRMGLPSIEEVVSIPYSDRLFADGPEAYSACCGAIPWSEKRDKAMWRGENSGNGSRHSN